MNKKKSASAFTIARACLVQSKLLNMRRILHRFRPKSDSDGGNCDKKAKGNSFLISNVIWIMFVARILEGYKSRLLKTEIRFRHKTVLIQEFVIFIKSKRGLRINKIAI